LLPAPTAPSEGSAGVRNLADRNLSAHRPALDPGSPAQASHSIEPLPRWRSPINLLDCVTRRLACLSIVLACHWTEVLSQSRPMFRGPSWVDRSCVPLCSSHVSAPSRVALEEDRLFRRLFPAGPKKNPKALPNRLPAEIGPSVACRALLCRFRPSGEAGTSVPITWSVCTLPPSRGSKIFGNKPVDNGDIGNNRRNHSRWPVELPIRSPSPTSAKCLNRLL
jgi:hypothetical protein